MKIWTSFKWFVCGFVLSSVLFSGTLSYAYRFGKPSTITEFNEEAVIVINNALEVLWLVANGRYNMDVVETAPTATATEGDIKGYKSGATYRLYMFIDDGWRYISTDG